MLASLFDPLKTNQVLLGCFWLAGAQLEMSRANPLGKGHTFKKLSDVDGQLSAEIQTSYTFS